MNNQLEELSDPTKFHDPVVIKGMGDKVLKDMLKSMILIRKTEQRLALSRKDGVSTILVEYGDYYNEK